MCNSCGSDKCKGCGKPESESASYDRTSERVVTPDGDKFCNEQCRRDHVEEKRYSWM